MNRLMVGALLCVVHLHVNAIHSYTDQKNVDAACELFAHDAYQASEKYNEGIMKEELIDMLEVAPILDTIKNRAIEAIEYVWEYKLDNPVMAYSLAMGACLKPRSRMAPMDEPWDQSPRTTEEHI